MIPIIQFPISLTFQNTEHQNTMNFSTFSKEHEMWLISEKHELQMLKKKMLMKIFRGNKNYMGNFGNF
jgi:hypothetical protein